MLGSMLTRVLGQAPGINVTGTVRGQVEESLLDFDARLDAVEELRLAECDWVINGIGVLASRIDEGDPESVVEAIEVNAAFPHRLAAVAGSRTRVIQVATDGVFSGSAGPYDEASAHNDPSVYARTKSLGEASGSNVLTLRCSIIGPEQNQGRGTSLLSWALAQPQRARIDGYTNHRRNGITTLHFARLCQAVILGRVDDLPSPLHVVPRDAVTKAELLELLLPAFGRSDVTVAEEIADTAVDRRLSTRHEDANHRLWAAAGYEPPPSIAEMVEELSMAVR
jgi:dTDP-4-dehydrorhamnose reductase